jgi:DNA-binding transcriptional ArsR family regulator
MSPNDIGAGRSPARPSAQSGRPELRKLSDASTLRALAHPVRVALIEELVLGGAMTATVLGERIGESPTTCSFHLRQLAKYGFVEEAGGGKGRARPWRMTSVGWDIASVHDDLESELAARAVIRLFRERELERYRTWLETKGTYPREWQQAASELEYLFFLTADELAQLHEELSALLLPRMQERIANPERRPAGAVPVEMLLFSFPVGHPAAGAGTEGEGTTA